MIYVALLRGINVGGNNKINMKLLKKAVEELGFRSVVTYINTGNIIFADIADYSSSNMTPDRKEKIEQMLEEAIHHHFGLQIKVLVLHLTDMERVVSALPDHWQNDQELKSDILFLWEEYDRESVMDQLELKPDIDLVIYVPGAILWSIDREHVNRSGMSKIIGTKLYRHVTVRNVNTARKVLELMHKVEMDVL